jgi:hypothetical protein
LIFDKPATASLSFNHKPSLCVASHSRNVLML